MNENELTTLLERAGDGLTPDVEGMVAGGAARGRRSLRRRRITSAFGAVAAVTVIASGVSLWSTDEAPTAVDDPGWASAPPAGERELADPDVIKDRLIGALPVGQVTNVKAQDHRDDMSGRFIDVRFDLDDASLTATVRIPQAAADVPEPGPQPASCDDYRNVIADAKDPGAALARVRPDRGVRTRMEMAADPEYSAWISCYYWFQEIEAYKCAQDAACWEERQTHPCITETDPKIACTEQADDSWLRSYSLSSYEDDPDRAAATIVTGVEFVTSEGWEIGLEVDEPNTAMSATAGPKVITKEDLVALAESGIWFE